MTVRNQPKSELVTFIYKTEGYLDQVVEHGTDQELFIASYLQGHFAVAAGQSQVQQMEQVSQLSELMSVSLNNAFINNELAQDDQKQVFSLWNSLLMS